MAEQTARKILIVEDDESMREILWVILKSDYQVMVAEDGESALKILAEEKDLKLVLLDILLPGIDGIEVLKRIKEKGYPVGVIMVSVVRDVDTVVQAMKLGAMDYIDKRFDFRGLNGLVAKAIEEIEGGK